MIIENDDGTTTNTHDPDRDQPTHSYLVQWEIEIDAPSAEDAIREAIQIMRDRYSIASYFRVDDQDEQTTQEIDAANDWREL